MEIKSYFSVLARRWWIWILVTLILSAAGYYVSGMIPPTYQADASLRVTTPLGGSMGDVSYQTYYADRLMNTYVQMASSATVLNSVKATLGVDKLPEVEAKIVPNSEIIQIIATGSDPELAARTANAVADAVITQSQEDSRSEYQKNLQVLTDRQKSLQQGQAQAKQEYTGFVTDFAKVNAQLTILERNIQSDETYYQGLQQEYQTHAVTQATSPYPGIRDTAKKAMDLLSTEMTRIDQELADLKRQYQSVSISSTEYSQQLTTARQNMQNIDAALSDLQSQLISMQIANTKYENAQSIVVGNLAAVPSKPTSISRSLIIVLGVLIGLFLGMLAAFLVDNLDSRILNTDEIHALSSMPIVGRIPEIRRKDRKNPLASDDISVQRAYWSLATKVLALQQNKGAKTVLITSPNPSEGKSTVIVGLAEGLARAKRRVLVIDADMRKLPKNKLFDVSSEIGLSNYLAGENSLDEVILHLTDKGVDYIPSGTFAEDPMDLLQTEQFQKLLKGTGLYDIVLVDSPALFAAPDAYNISVKLDGILLLAQRKRTTIDDFKAALSQLDDVSSKLLGTIINHDVIKRSSGYYQGYSYRMNRSKAKSKLDRALDSSTGLQD